MKADRVKAKRMGYFGVYPFRLRFELKWLS